MSLVRAIKVCQCPDIKTGCVRQMFAFLFQQEPYLGAGFCSMIVMES